jgi:hypothetical protein
LSKKRQIFRQIFRRKYFQNHKIVTWTKWVSDPLKISDGKKNKVQKTKAKMERKVSSTMTRLGGQCCDFKNIITKMAKKFGYFVSKYVKPFMQKKS